MGYIYVLCGPSGVGKTTLLNSLVPAETFEFLPRYTDRPIRKDEQVGFEYFFTSYEGMLKKVYANDFIHFEKWGDFHSGIETRLIRKTIESDKDGIILASIFGASRLKASFGDFIKVLYLWTGLSETLYNPTCLEKDNPEIQELKWRILKKIKESRFSEYELKNFPDEDFFEKRMIDNYLDIASVNGRLRSGENITVIPNIHDRLDSTVSNLVNIQRLDHDKKQAYAVNKKCFVLMPFKEEMRPVYDDHIMKVCQKLNISVTRADQIFSINPVIDDILQSVREADILIADMTDNNPNVFYEIGICHAMKKQVILITQNNTVPFDLNHIRRIQYDFTPRGMANFEFNVEQTLKGLISNI